jgi:hypothetical protein
MREDTDIELFLSNKINVIKDFNQSNFKISLIFDIHPVDIVRLNEVKYLYSKKLFDPILKKLEKLLSLLFRFIWCSLEN